MTLPAAPQQADLMPSLWRLVKGLTALFWGLPLTLIVCVQGATTDWLRNLGPLPPVVTTAVLYYGLHLLGDFQRQERIWTEALERARLFGLVNLGLSPFIYWWGRFPGEVFSAQAVWLMTISGVLFLVTTNLVLQRLTAMLPDETLRTETRLFTTMNLGLIAGLMLLVAGYLVLAEVKALPVLVVELLNLLYAARRFVLLLLILLPLAMTMTLTWKIKEAVLVSVFGARG